ncbi:MAG: DUF134 domain-containing protein [Anaerovoracaceae bacterium]
MSRPRKKRRVCCMPEVTVFAPLGIDQKYQPVNMSIDEYETIRLIDLEGLSQDHCAARMSVARTTVQSIYDSARSKLANFIVNGTQLNIQGGEYLLCNESMSPCGHVCPKGKCHLIKGGSKMKVAVTYAQGEVFQHFGQTKEFKLYTIEDSKILDSKVISSEGFSHGDLAKFLKDQGVTTLICGGIGAGARVAITETGIELLPGANGNADKAVNDLLDGALIYNPDITCNHHHHEEGESCKCHK